MAPCRPLPKKWSWTLSFEHSLSFRQVRFKLEALGFRGISQTSHHAKFICEQPGRLRTAILPHYTELSAGVVRSILRQAQVSEEEFAGVGI